MFKKEKTRLKLVPTIPLTHANDVWFGLFVINRSNKPIDGFFLQILYLIYKESILPCSINGIIKSNNRYIMGLTYSVLFSSIFK